MIALIFVALLQGVAGPPEAPNPETVGVVNAPAQSTGQTGVGTSLAEPAEEQVRCRRQPVLGTRLSARVCTTVREDQAAEDEARDATNRMQSQMSGN